MRILMIRHGRTDWNAARRIQGHADIPLSESGRREQVGRRLPPEFTDADIWSSPLQRAWETAVCMGLPAPATDARLIEMNFGEWSGRTHAEIRAEDPETLAALESQGLDMRPPDGETPRETMARLLAFIGEQTAPRLVIFAHKGVIRAGLSAALDWDMKQEPPVHIDWCAGQLFDFREGRLSLLCAALPLSGQ